MNLRRRTTEMMALLLLTTALLLGDVGGVEETQPSQIQPEQPTTQLESPKAELGPAKLPQSPQLPMPEPEVPCDDSCALPHCYCNSTEIPGGLSRADTPQMVLFTFNDPVTEKVRKKLIEIFPDKISNPNTECPITITIFAIGTGTDYCAVHKMYVRGHEIASGGMNRTGMTEDWTKLDWDNQIGAQVTELTEKAYMPGTHVRGARAPLQKPGGDEMFSMLYDKGFMYDSTLLAGPRELGSEVLLPWPITLDVPYSPRFQCLTPKCPRRSFPGLWEVPLVRLVNPELNRHCAYLDDCLVTMKTPDDVYKLLYRNFHQHYETNRSPMIINLATKTIRNRLAVQGLQKFIAKLTSDEHDDTWIVSIQEAIQWIQSPTPLSQLGNSDLFSCENRNYHHCQTALDSESGGRKSRPPSPFRSILFVDQLWLMQTAFLFFGYLAVLRYDKLLDKK